MDFQNWHIAAIGEKNRQVCPHQSVAKIACDFRWRSNFPRSACKKVRRVTGLNATLAKILWTIVFNTSSEIFRLLSTTSFALLKPATHLARSRRCGSFEKSCDKSPDLMGWLYLRLAAMTVENRGNGHTWRMPANIIADIWHARYRRFYTLIAAIGENRNRCIGFSPIAAIGL